MVIVRVLSFGEFWICCCGAGHLVYSSMKALYPRCRACPDRAVWTAYCQESNAGRGAATGLVPAESSGGAAGADTAAAAGAAARTAPPARGEPASYRAPTGLEQQLVDGLPSTVESVLRNWIAYTGREYWAAEGDLNEQVGRNGGAVGHVRAGADAVHALADRCPAVHAAKERLEVAEELQVELLKWGSTQGPHFLCEARSLPGRWMAPVDVSMLRPFGSPHKEGWPFGAVMQVDGNQHLFGGYKTVSSRRQRQIDMANDTWVCAGSGANRGTGVDRSAAWLAGMPVLRIAAPNMALLAEARRLFLLAVLANPGKPFIMYTKRFYSLIDWHWVTSVLKAKKIGHLSGYGLFMISKKELTLLEPVPPQPGQALAAAAEPLEAAATVTAAAGQQVEATVQQPETAGQKDAATESLGGRSDSCSRDYSGGGDSEASDGPDMDWEGGRVTEYESSSDSGDSDESADTAVALGPATATQQQQAASAAAPVAPGTWPGAIGHQHFSSRRGIDYGLRLILHRDSSKQPADQEGADGQAGAGQSQRRLLPVFESLRCYIDRKPQRREKFQTCREERWKAEREAEAAKAAKKAAKVAAARRLQEAWRGPPTPAPSSGRSLASGGGLGSDGGLTSGGDLTSGGSLGNGTSHGSGGTGTATNAAPAAAASQPVVASLGTAAVQGEGSSFHKMGSAGPRMAVTATPSVVKAIDAGPVATPQLSKPRKR
ncbi:hypothetical protein GPECTOR_87g398 [Gonium pectorale]|uniref:Uncharacterized protein n=1 Tax=Gonium pectorale TaxID=33097 RepID=A0A150G122_GONPE|nr:hypothetical protein GPECTOR_87g398 [Gonium pectorale]|eukprot:KXZ43537.1 hypothetical protein GPECTOR_87g398 [Gonium pectorale]